MSKNVSVNVVSLPTLLGVAFVVLKLTDVINWSWWWVTCPFWIGPVVAILFIGLGLIWFFLQKRRNSKV